MSCRCPVNVRKFVVVFSDLYDISYIFWRCHLVRDNLIIQSVYKIWKSWKSWKKSVFTGIYRKLRKSLSFGKLVKCFLSYLKKSWNVEILILCFKRVLKSFSIIHCIIDTWIYYQYIIIRVASHSGLSDFLYFARIKKVVQDNCYKWGISDRNQDKVSIILWIINVLRHMASSQTWNNKTW